MKMEVHGLWSQQQMASTVWRSQSNDVVEINEENGWLPDGGAFLAFLPDGVKRAHDAVTSMTCSGSYRLVPCATEYG